MNIGIVGYGKMGAGIFKVLSRTFENIVVLVRSEEQAKENARRHFKGLERSLKRKTLTEDEFLKKKESLKFTHRWEGLQSADIVIESIAEDYQEKVRVLRRLESVIHGNTVLVSNTSSISTGDLRAELRHGGRFCGLHFFHPVVLIGLVEIVRCTDTSKALVAFLQDFCDRIKKRSIVVLDAPGSVINAILAYYYAEALYILEEGLALPSKIDELARRYFYVGPCESMDVIGIDFFVGALERAATPGSLSPIRWAGGSRTELSKEDTGGREGFFIPHLFGKLICENRLGKKISRGLYLYEKEKPLDDVTEFYVNPARVRPRGVANDCEAFVTTRLLYSIFNGVLYSLKTGMSSMSELDVGVREVLNMKEGPFTMMRALGEERVKEAFDGLTRSAGIRFRQTALESHEEM